MHTYRYKSIWGCVESEVDVPSSNSSNSVAFISHSYKTWYPSLFHFTYELNSRVDRSILATSLREGLLWIRNSGEVDEKSLHYISQQLGQLIHNEKKGMCRVMMSHILKGHSIKNIIVCLLQLLLLPQM